MSEGYSSKPMQATKIGDRIVRVDAVQKARGEAVYVCDMTLPDMQYAYMVRSTIARGRIKAIHVPELPEGYYFISAKDIPAQGKNELWMIAKDWRCFAEDYGPLRRRDDRPGGRPRPQRSQADQGADQNRLRGADARRHH